MAPKTKQELRTILQERGKGGGKGGKDKQAGGAQAKSKRELRTILQERGKAGGKGGQKEEEIDMIAALDAQAEQIGDLLESRVDEIDTHWRHSGDTKPGAVPKSGKAGQLGAGAKAAAPLGAAALGADAKVAPPVKEPAAELGAHAKAAAPLGAAALGADAKVSAPAKAPPLPFKAPPPKAPPAKAALGKSTEAGDEEEDDDYDPFSELPVPEVSGDDLVKDLVSTVQAMQEESNRTIRSLQDMQAKLAAADAKAKSTPPWRKKKPDYVAPASGVTLADLRVWSGLPPRDTPFAAAVPQTKAAAPKCAVPIAGAKSSAEKRTSARIDAASERAKKYFKPATDEKSAAQKDGTSVGPGGKRKGVEVTVTFTQEVLDKAPATLQTCRSLLLFLDKKLEGPLASAPSCGGPEDLRVRLESYAYDAGRAEGLRAGGWDARAKRIVDIGAVTKSSAGEALLNAADQMLEKAKPDLEKELQERGEKKLEDLVSERKKWVAQECVRRDFFSWCAKVLRTREAALLKDGGEEVASSQTGKSGGLGPSAIFEAILKGSSGLSPSKAGG